MIIVCHEGKTLSKGGSARRPDALKGREMLFGYLESVFKLSLMVLCLTALLSENNKLERAFAVRMRPPAPPVSAPEKDAVEETLIDLHAPQERLPSLKT